MRIYGKIFGGIIGWLLLRHPMGAVIGLALGHALDAGWFSSHSAAAVDDALVRAYQTLSIDPSVDDQTVDQAYRRMMGQYHPDKVAGAAEEIRKLAEDRASAINAAYDTVMAARRKSAA